MIVDIVNSCLTSGMAIFDDNKITWNYLVDQILASKGTFIALRGAGSVNGMDRLEADRLLSNTLFPDIERLLKVGKVTILYDGDNDELEKPDIGYIAGRLLDRFGNNSNGALFIAVQKLSWYSPKRPNGNILNAYNMHYVTYIIEGGVYPGDHSEFTQDARLVACESYEQWYIGASGKISEEQLVDFNNKVPIGQKRSATVFRLHNNPGLDVLIESRLQTAIKEEDTVRIEKFQNQLKHRKFVYGAHWKNDGTPRISAREFPNLDVSFIVP